MEELENKSFEIKVYNIDWTIKDTISKDKIEQDFSYSSNINWCQWEANIILNVSFEDNNIIKWDVIKVIVFTKKYQNWINIYTWMVNNITRLINSWIEQIELRVTWLWSLLNNTYYQNLTNDYVFSKTAHPHDIIKEIIDDFNSKYPYSWITYTTTSIEEINDNVNIDFNYTKSFEAIKNLSNLVWFNFFIDWDWIMNFKSKETILLWIDSAWDWNWYDSDEDWIWTETLTESYVLTIWLDIDTLEVEENSERIINKYILEWKSWTLVPTEDLTSQGIYWIRELKESKTEIADITTAQLYADNYILKNKEQTRKISVIVNNKFDIEDLHPTDLISVRNINYEINNCQIQKIDYSLDRIKLYVESFNDLGKEIFNN